MKWPWSKNKIIKSLSPLEGYNLWAHTYNEESNPIKNLSDKLVEKFLPDLVGKNVLDAGCGSGKFCLMAEKNNASKILGIDLSPKMIERARSYCPASEFRCDDISVSPIQKNSYDIIICALVLAHIENLKPALNNLLSGLKKGGTLIVTDFHPFLTMLKSKRTFKDYKSGETYEISHHLHLFEEYFTLFREYDAIVEELKEPFFNESPVVFGMKVIKTK